MRRPNGDRDPPHPSCGCAGAAMRAVDRAVEPPSMRARPHLRLHRAIGVCRFPRRPPQPREVGSVSVQSRGGMISTGSRAGRRWRTSGRRCQMTCDPGAVGRPISSCEARDRASDALLPHIATVAAAACRSVMLRRGRTHTRTHTHSRLCVTRSRSGPAWRSCSRTGRSPRRSTTCSDRLCVLRARLSARPTRCSPVDGRSIRPSDCSVAVGSSARRRRCPASAARLSARPPSCDSNNRRAGVLWCYAGCRPLTGSARPLPWRAPC